ncbi:hypothetical protein [Streptomyces sp. NPDC054961]
MSFNDARFLGPVDFCSVFSGGTVLFGTTFSRGTVSFRGAEFSGATVGFSGAEFSGATVSFRGARFSAGVVEYCGTKFSDGQVTFRGAGFIGADVSFLGAVFSGAKVDLSSASGQRPSGLVPPSEKPLPDGLTLPRDAYGSAGDLDRAIPLYEQNLTEAKRVLGEDHPLTRRLPGSLTAAIARRDGGTMPPSVS